MRPTKEEGIQDTAMEMVNEECIWFPTQFAAPKTSGYSLLFLPLFAAFYGKHPAYSSSLFTIHLPNPLPC